MQRRISRYLTLVLLVGALVVLTSRRTAEAAPPASHQDLENQIANVQSTVDSIDARVDAIQSQLDQASSDWSEILPAAERFVSVLGGAGVLDKETGLVWEKAPDSESDPADRKTWAAAEVHCNMRTVANRKGWRLPTAQELASLLDPSAAAPMLPAGHPFQNIQPYAYWSTTVHADEPGAAWFVNFNDSAVFVVVKSFDQLYAWCVRGGHAGTDTQ